MSSSLRDATSALASMPDAADLAAADSRHVIHGFSPFGDRTPGPIFKSGRGITLTDVEGQDWLDACAGQANVALGYGRTDIADAVADALRELTFGTHFYQRRSHVGASRLAERLARITPAGLDQFVYMLGGSDAVETAIKIARFSNAAIGRPEKMHIIGRWNSYHGVTYAGSSMTGDPAMWRNIGPRLEGFSHIDQPETDSVGAARLLEDEILRIGADKVAAFMAEPISTPNGIVVPPADYWAQIREICHRYDILLISDEVLTGFGRSGTMFAVENWDLRPDILTMSKAITAGFFPLAVVAISGELREKLSASSDAFVHGVTAGGHPAACAAALATLDIYERENVLANSVTAGRYLSTKLHALADSYPVLDKSSVRGIGMMHAVDLDPEAVDPDYGAALHAEFLKQRVFVRTYRANQTIGLLPSLTLTTEDIDAITGRMAAALDVTRPSVRSGN
ncbi:aspartate aminotransferase family protein [Mycobacterium sp. WMMD1722]|uniref:aminotransferase family protein n=1 Tax=Mycobacterium sp. WMMD1722 TaxID=3404117 RepID=UPI003BF612B4